MAGRVHQHQCAQDARLRKGQGDQRLLQGQRDVANRIGRQLGGFLFGQGVDVQAVHHPLHLGLDPAVAVQRPVHAAGHQGFVVHPGDRGVQRALAFGGAFGGQKPVAARDVHLAVQHDAGAVTGRLFLRLAGRRQHLRNHCGLAAGEDLHGLTGRNAAGGHAAPEHAAALSGHAGVVEFFDPLHREAEGHLVFCRGDGQVFQDFEQVGAVVAAPALVAVHHVPALESRHGHHGGDADTGFSSELRQGTGNVCVGQRGVFNGIELVDGKHDGGHAQQVHQQRMAAGLR